MIHPSVETLEWLAWLPLFLYVTAPRTWLSGEMVTANMMNTLRDLFLEIEAGTAELMKIQLMARTTGELASDLSVTGTAKVAYNTTEGRIQASVDGEAYLDLGGSFFFPADPLFISWGID